MGIKHFFGWFQKHYPECISTHRKSVPLDIDMDTLALDLNGIFHPCAQRVFQYGAHKPLTMLLSREHIPYDKLERQFFQEVCREIESLLKYVHPRKRLLLCVDGVAGCSKQNQQRSRRFKSAMENSDSKFDSTAITPGTELMHRLCAHIDFYVRKRIHESEVWQSLDVIYSSEKVPGEGEHTAKNLINKYTDKDERCCIFGLDADLIMLGLAIERDNVFILRDNIYTNNQRFLIDIHTLECRLKEFLEAPNAVSDFILLCFLMGNDFLPNIPSLEIITGGIDTVMSVYRRSCLPFGITMENGDIRFDSLEDFFGGCADVELESLKEKYRRREHYFPDPLMEAYFTEINAVEEDGQSVIESDFEAYRTAYYKQHFPDNVSIEHICHEYLYGMQWILHYYLKKIPSWTWCYPYLYAPFLCDLERYSKTMRKVSYPYSEPAPPFQQLLSVLPPQSSKLLPKTLRRLTTSDTSPLIEYYPTNFQVDVSGKRQEWEGIVKIPVIDQQKLAHVYRSASHSLDKHEKRRNIKEFPVRYELNTQRAFRFRTRYGQIERCNVYTIYLK